MSTSKAAFKELGEKARWAYLVWPVMLVLQENKILEHMSEDARERHEGLVKRAGFVQPQVKVPDFASKVVNIKDSSNSYASTSVGENQVEKIEDIVESQLVDSHVFESPFEGMSRDAIEDIKSEATLLFELGFPVPDSLERIPLPQFTRLHNGSYVFLCAPAHDYDNEYVLLFIWSGTGDMSETEFVEIEEIGRVETRDRQFLISASNAFQALMTYFMYKKNKSEAEALDNVYFYARLWARMHDFLEKAELPTDKYVSILQNVSGWEMHTVDQRQNHPRIEKHKLDVAGNRLSSTRVEESEFSFGSSQLTSSSNE